MIAHIIPLKKLPRHLSYFDYYIPPHLIKKLKVGHVVNIPWRNQVIVGLVKAIDKNIIDKPVKVKNIIDLAHPLPLATIGQIKLIEKLSDKFLTAESVWWKMILPTLPKRKINLPANISSSPILSNSNKAQLKLIMPNSYTDMIEMIKKHISPKGQTLIICPEIKQIEQVLPSLPENFKAIAFHKKLALRKLLHHYLMVQHNQAQIVVGTRLSVLLPWSSLRQIIVFKSEDYSLKQADQNPRFWIHDILPEAEKIYENNTYYFTLAPRLETYAYIKARKGKIKNEQLPPTVQITSLSDFWHSGEYSFISPQLEMAIKQTLSKNKTVFLLVNRKKLGLRVKCYDCQSNLTCSNCQIDLLVLSESALMCPDCHQTTTMPSSCPNCGSVKLKIRGLTNQRLTKELKNKIANANIQFIDSEHDCLDKKAQIIVGTQFAFSLLDPQKIGLVGIVMADQELNSVDFRGIERAWQLFSYFIRWRNDLPVVIQTFSPDHYLFQYLTTGDYYKFWLTEMKWRRQLNYPPYSKIIKLIKTDSDKNKAEQILTEVKSNLKKILPPTVEISPINLIKLPTKTKQYQASFFLKYKRENIANYLQEVPPDIILDFNPYYLL